MAESDFLVTLPSNSNMKTHPSNEPANYTVKLAEPLQLEGDWEAALVSVQYTPNWVSFKEAIKIMVVRSDRNYPNIVWPSMYRNNPGGRFGLGSLGLAEFCRQIENDVSDNILDEVRRTTPGEQLKYCLVTIQPKYFDTIEALGAEICKRVKEAFPEETINITYIYDVNLKKGQFLTVGCEILMINVRDRILGDLLGHQAVRLVSKSGNPNHMYYAIRHYGGYSQPKLPRVNSLWIYSNITQNQQVGDSKVPLLGIIPTQTDGRKRIHYTVNPVHFQALNRNHISEISIQIVDDLGNRIPFTKGEDEDNLVCCLRFRRRKTPMPI